MPCKNIHKLTTDRHTSAGYRVTLQHRGKIHVKLFSLRKYGTYPAALAAAQAHLTALRLKLKLPLTPHTNAQN